MKKRILAFTLVVLSLVTVLAGCSPKIYDYDNYGKYIELGATEGIEINQSDIDDGILNAFHGLYDKTTDKLTETTYSSKEDDVYIQKGDTVNIDYTGKRKDTGVAFEGGTATGYDLTIGSNTFIDGFEDKLVGYKVGDTPKLELTFPEDYHNDELRGQDVIFEVTVNSIKRIGYPEFNDENVKAKTNWNSKEEFSKDAEITVKNNLIWQKLYSSSTVLEFPKDELEKYYEASIDNIESQATLYGMSFSSFVKQYYGSDLSNESARKGFYTSLASQARSQVKQELLILRIIELKPELMMTEETYKAEAEKLRVEQNFDGSLKKFEKQYGRKALEITIYYDIVIDYLRANCVVKDDVTKNGFITDRNGVRYYKENEFLTGWQSLDFDGDGSAALYYFDSNGYATVNASKMVTLMGATEETLERFGENGLHLGSYTGKLDDKTGTRYYENGVMLTGPQTLELDSSIDGKENYYFDITTGYMVKNGVAEIEGVYYRYGQNGVRVSQNEGRANGYVYDDAAKSFRFFDNGALITGWVHYDNDTVTRGDFTDVVKDGKYYYCDTKTGFAVKTVTKIDDKYYAFNAETGAYAGEYSGVVAEADKTKLVNNGVLLTGWVKFDDENNVYNDVTSFVENDGEYYYCDVETGAMAKTTTKIGEKYYAFNAETGVCVGLYSGTFEDKNIVEGVEQPAQ